MSRVAAQQSDLFAPAPAAPPTEPDPVQELARILAELQAAERLPWPTISAAMQAEYRVMHLARQAGERGAPLAASVAHEIERLFADDDRRQLGG